MEKETKKKMAYGCLELLRVALIYPIGMYFFWLILKAIDATPMMYFLYWAYWIGNIVFTLIVGTIQQMYQDAN
jgi:hypothetical protein